MSPVDVSSRASARKHSGELVEKNKVPKKRSQQDEYDESNCSSSWTELGSVPKDANDPKRIKLDDSNIDFTEDDIADIIEYIIQ